MDRKTNDQEWQNLQARIDGLFRQLVAGETGAIDYKPQGVVSLLEMPAKYQKAERQEKS